MENQSSLPKKVKFLIFAISFLALAGLAAAGFMWFKLQTQPAAEKDELQTIIAEVEKHFLLPEGETPNLMTVENLNQVKDLPFFINAVVGDKVLIYPNNSKAVLWRPSTKKIIEASIINLTAPQAN